MFLYSTVEEKAAEWGVSAQLIQKLCRQGKIEGALKRGGVWFIPQDTGRPLEKKGSEEEVYGFSGTKRAIFENAIHLFVKNGFESVSVKDIADAVGIRQSAIYNHFTSKDELLEAIYDYYAYYNLADRPHLDDLEVILRDGSVTEIITSVLYNYKPEHEELMLEATKIVYQRKYTDERARKLVKEQTVDEGIGFAKAVMDRAVEIGRLAPFDTYAMSLFINSMRFFILHCWVLDPNPESIAQFFESEAALYRQAANLLQDLKEQRERE